MMGVLKEATLETIYMAGASLLMALIIGLPIGIILFITAPGGLRQNRVIFSVLDFIINILRSIPFIILMIILRPIASVITGKTIGPGAAIVSLTAAAVPFFARLAETSFKKIDVGITEAAVSMGSGLGEIIRKVLIPEALPDIVNDLTVTLINLIGYSAMAGSIGGGGLGNLAVRYGLYNYRIDYLIAAVAVIVILVQLVQFTGSSVYRVLKKA